MFTKRRSSKNLTVQIGYDGLGNGKSSSKKNLHSRSNSAHNAASDAASVTSSHRTASTPSPQMIPASSGGTPPMVASPAGPPPSTESTTTAAKVPKASTAALRVSSSHAAAAAEPPAKSLVIGEGVLFEGTTEGCAAAIVGGKLRGTIKSRRLEITRTGKMEGTAIAETAEIAGVFEGNLTVLKSLKICSTGRLKGDVSFGSIVVENGGKIEGKVNFSKNRSSPSSSFADAPSTSPSKMNPVTAAGVRSTDPPNAPSTPPPTGSGKSASTDAGPRASNGVAPAVTAGDDPAPLSPECPAEVNALVTPTLMQSPE